MLKLHNIFEKSAFYRENATINTFLYWKLSFLKLPLVFYFCAKF